MDFRTIIEIIGALASIFAILGGLFVANRYFQRVWRHSGKYMNEYTRHTFFYPLSFAAKILQKNVFEPLGESQFINYAAALSKDFYTNDVAQVKLKIGKNIKELDLPYKEIIDYIAHPDARTMIKGGKIESRFDLGERYMALTQPNFDEFLRERPKTTNGPALRLKSLAATRWLSRPSAHQSHIRPSHRARHEHAHRGFVGKQAAASARGVGTRQHHRCVGYLGNSLPQRRQKIAPSGVSAPSPQADGRVLRYAGHRERCG